MNKVSVKAALNAGEPLSDILVQGWVRTRRDAKGFSFLEINDGSCLKNLQVIVEEALPAYGDMKGATTGAAVAVTGDLVASPGQGQQWEVKARGVRILGEADPETYPLQKKRHSDEYLRTIAHLRPRTNKFGAMFRIRSESSFSVHQFFRERGFYYLHTPIITGSDCEGAGEMFRVTTLPLNFRPETPEAVVNPFVDDFFGQESGLTVSGQLEAELFASALGRVYTFGPTFRAENSNTPRHAAEFWMIEPEAAFADLNDNMDLAEDMIQYMIRHVMTQCASDLELFAKFVDKDLMPSLENIVTNQFERLPYRDAVEIMKKSGKKFEFPVEFGTDLQTEHERFLCEEHFKKPVIVYNYPKTIKAFYMRLNDDDETVAAMDVLVPRVGELVGGSQREERLNVLQRRIREMGLKEDNYWWYLDIRRFGTVPHSGFGLGFERFLMMVTGVTNIRDVIAFPRTPKHVEFQRLVRLINRCAYGKIDHGGRMLSTIRGRIVSVFIACLAFVIVLTAFHYWNLASIENALATTEDFEDLFNEILEIRRYEKNLLFYNDKDSLTGTLSYIEKAEGSTDKLAQGIADVTGQGQFLIFKKNLDEYKHLMEARKGRMESEVSPAEMETIRAKGKELVDFAQQVLRIKRENMHRALTRTFTFPLAFAGLLVLVLALIFQLVVKNILKPLNLIRRTTVDVAQGNFIPIPYQREKKDEISRLIGAFNKMADEIEARREEVVQSRKIAAIGTFTSGIAHELNNPINNIYLTAETLLDEAASLDDGDTKELLLDILNQAGRASDIVKNLLDFSRQEQQMPFTPVDVSEVIDSTLKLIKNQISIAGVRSEIEILDNLPLINGRFRNLQQVFLNLFLNAVQAMPNGGSLSISAQKEGEDSIQVDVSDTGIGIKPEDMEHIFDPFFTTKGGERGTGLGLSVTYGIVKKHGGQITVKSQVDVGTTFSVHLPINRQLSANGQ